MLGHDDNLIFYFISDSSLLKSIIIKNGGVKSEISNIVLAIEETLKLEIGDNNSTSFDLR